MLLHSNRIAGLVALSAAALALCLAPAAMTFSLGPHIATGHSDHEHHKQHEHHGDEAHAEHHAEHRAKHRAGDMTELARALEHGHHHDASTPDHKHHVELPDAQLTPTQTERYEPAAAQSALAVSALEPTLEAERPWPRLSLASRWGPGESPPLFEVHCSLLI